MICGIHNFEQKYLLGRGDKGKYFDLCLDYKKMKIYGLENEARENFSDLF